MATSTKTTEAEAEAALADITAQIASLRKDLAGLTEAMGDYASAQGRALGDRAARTATTAREQGQAQAAELQAQANDFITRQPGLALGLAAGLGYLVGLLSSRK